MVNLTHKCINLVFILTFDKILILADVWSESVNWSNAINKVGLCIHKKHLYQL